MTQPAFGRRAQPRFASAPSVPAAPLPRISLAADPATAAMDSELRQWKQDWNRRRMARFKTARWIGAATAVAAIGCQFLVPDPLGDRLSTLLGAISFAAFIAGFARRREPPAG